MLLPQKMMAEKIYLLVGGHKGHTTNNRPKKKKMEGRNSFFLF